VLDGGDGVDALPEEIEGLPACPTFEDDTSAMRLAVDHLAALGHRSITHVDGGPGIKGSDRRDAYRAAMIEAGLADHIQVISGGQTCEAGFEAGNGLLQQMHLPSALVSYNDDSAWGLMRALDDAGLSVPEDMSVVGYDACRVWRQVPQNLTTIAQDSEALASLGVERALARLRGYEGDDRDIVLPPTLTIGRTTARVGSRSRDAQDPDSGQARVVSGARPGVKASSARP
jgi:DNA-binding LacI/PurR family transcriptional regulator